MRAVGTPGSGAARAGATGRVCGRLGQKVRDGLWQSGSPPSSLAPTPRPSCLRSSWGELARCSCGRGRRPPSSCPCSQPPAPGGSALGRVAERSPPGGRIGPGSPRGRRAIKEAALRGSREAAGRGLSAPPSLSLPAFLPKLQGALAPVPLASQPRPGALASALPRSRRPGGWGRGRGGDGAGRR